MLRKSLFAFASVLALGSFTACGDDKKDDDKKPVDPDVVNCDKTPDHEECAGRRAEPAYSYLSGLTIPEEDACCVDFNNDGALDNDLAKLLGILSGALGEMIGDLDVQAEINNFLESGAFSLLFKHIGIQEDINEQAKRSFNIEVYLGDSESSWEDRQGNKGVFTLDGAALTTIEGATTRRGVIEFQKDKFPLSINLAAISQEATDLLGLEVLTLNLDDVQLKVQVAEEVDGGINSTGNITDSSGKPSNYLTGIITLNEIARLVNDILGGMCIDGPNVELASVGTDEDGAPSLVFVDLEEVKDWKTDDEICGTVGGILPMVGGLLPTLLGGDGMPDNLTLGVNIELAGASIAAE